MSGDRIVAIEMSRPEIAQLAALVTQFQDLLQDAADAPGDPAIGRLFPDAYPDDSEASAEYRRLTSADLLERRSEDAGLVLGSLSRDGELPQVDDLDETSVELTTIIALEDRESAAWLRTLTGLRLVLASRLGITSEADGEPGDPRFFLYEWLGVRLEGLVQALST